MLKHISLWLSDKAKFLLCYFGKKDQVPKKENRTSASKNLMNLLDSSKTWTLEIGM